MFNVDLIAVLLIGLLTGFGHCIGMCGGFVMTYTLKLAENTEGEKSNWWTKLYPHLLYNSGRVLTYVLLGELFGFLGSTLAFTSMFKGFQGGLMLFAGLIMIFMGLDLAGFFPSMSPNSFVGVSKFKTYVRNMVKRVRPGNIFGLGLVLGFLPCGPVYAMAAKAAVTQSIIGGGLTMLFFGLGTFPAMVLTGVGANLLSARFRSRLYKIAAIMVIILGVVTVGKSMKKFGLIGSPVTEKSAQECCQ